MRKYNISADLVRTIEQLYDKATSAVQMNGSIEWFRTTVGVRQECLLSPTLFNILVEWIMSDALEEHDGKVSIGSRKIQAAIGEYDELLTLVKKRKLRWFGQVSRSSGLAKTILRGTVKGKRKRGRQKKRWDRQYQRVDRNGLCQLN